MKAHFSLFFLILQFTLSSQSSLDSIKKALGGSLHDTVAFNLDMRAGLLFQDIKPDSAVAYHRKAYVISNKAGNELRQLKVLYELIWDYYLLNDNINAIKSFNEARVIADKTIHERNSSEEIRKAKRIFAGCLSNIGSVYKNRSQIKEALEYYNQSAEMSRDIGNSESMAAAYSNISTIYQELGNYVKALEYDFAALKIFENSGNKPYQAGILGNIALVYSYEGDFKKALNYSLRALKLNEETNSRSQVPVDQENIGIQYSQLNDQEKAEEYFLQALANYKAIDNNYGLANVYGNLGMLYRGKAEIAIQKKSGNGMAEYEKAIDYTRKAIDLSRNIENRQGEAFNLSNMGYIYASLKKFALAEKYTKEAIDIAMQINSFNTIKEANYNLYYMYEQSGRAQPALEHYKLYIRYRDSVFNHQKLMASLQQEVNFAYGMKMAADSVKAADEKKVTEAKFAASEARFKQERTLRFALYSGLVVLIAFLLFVVNRMRITRRQKELIEMQKLMVESQKEMVEQKQKEILDSIHYAKRIQTAMLSNEKYISRVIDKLKAK